MFVYALKQRLTKIATFRINRKYIIINNIETAQRVRKPVSTQSLGRDHPKVKIGKQMSCKLVMVINYL